MDEKDKLRVLIPHWIEHNKEHAKEFQDWAKNAGDAAEDILSAVEIMEQANLVLEKAIEKLGGPLEYDHAHHHHHHD
jgi:hypothetical protein